jgi:hypothetical protein
MRFEKMRGLGGRETRGRGKERETYDIKALGMILIPSDSEIGVHQPLLVGIPSIASVSLNDGSFLSIRVA